MKKTFAFVSACVLAVCALSSCGDSKADKAERLADAAGAVDSVLCDFGAPVCDVKAVAAEADINISFAVNDSAVNVSEIGDELMDYFVAQQLKIAPKELVNETVKAAEGTEGSVRMAVSDIYGNTHEYTFTPETLRHLYKAKGSQLNAPRVKEQLCTALQGALPACAANAQADNISLSVDKGFLTYNVVFPTDKMYANASQGVLTGRYMDGFKTLLDNLGSLREPFLEMCKSLSVDGFCVKYTALNGDKELRQAFPWRVITE